MKNLISRTIISQLPRSVAIVCIFGALHLAIQQSIRLSANQVPMQYATDVRDKLEKGITQEQSISGIGKTDMLKTLAPFVIICDLKGSAETSTITLNGFIPVPPPGAFEVAKQTHENRLSWQPRQDVRNAIVILPYTIDGEEGYVVAGRSLRETEKLEHYELCLAIAACIFTLIATNITSFVIKLLAKPKST